VEAFTTIHPIVSDSVRDVLLSLFQQRITLVFTSAHAVEILETHYLHQPDTYYVPGLWNICCLEAGTLDAVKKALPQCTIKATAANATALANAITALGDVREVYFICGKQRRDELPAILQQHHITVHELVVYENAATPAKMDAAAYDGVFFFSPSAVQSFFSVNTLPAATVCFAIGDTTAAALRTVTNNKIIISGSPSAYALLDAATAYFNKL
jgi:uroporphyrinogen-III synthase